MTGYNKSRVLHHLARQFIERARPQVQHTVYLQGLKQMGTQLLERRKEHPALHIYHAILPVLCQPFLCYLHKDREQVRFPRLIILLYIVRQHDIHIATTHIRRIHHQSVIPFRQCQDDAHVGQQATYTLSGHRLLFILLRADSKNVACALREAELHDAAQVVRLVHQAYSIGQFRDGLAVVRHYIIGQRTGQMLLIGIRLRHVQHTGHTMAVGKGGITLASLQQQGELRQLLGAGVDVDARQVAAEDVLDGLAAAVALIDI